MRLELTHFKGLERKAGQAKYTDPGAASAVFYLRDIDTAVANAKKANAPIVTTGGAPVEITTAKGKARSIILRDPDGFFLQLIQETPAAGAPESNVHRVTLAYTMENADATRALIAVPRRCGKGHALTHLSLTRAAARRCAGGFVFEGNKSRRKTFSNLKRA